MTRTHPIHRSRSGFSMVEVLVTLGIIVILIGLLLPTLGQARQTARLTDCSSNLHQIGLALTNWHVKKNPDVMAPAGWRAELGKYADDAKEIFKCEQPDDPEGTAIPTTSTGANTGGGANGPLQIYVENTKTATKLEEGPWMKKTDVSPDGKSYILRFEDIQNGGGDFDFNDVVLECTEGADGTFSLKVKENSHGYTFRLQDSTGKDLLDGKEFGRDSAGTGNGYTYTYQYPIDSDYAMNSHGDRVRRVPNSAEKILFLDYRNRDVATPEADAAIWGTFPRFARHFQRINVLYGDGSVRLASPSEIDIANGKARDKYWTP